MLGSWARRSWAGLAVLDLTVAGSAWLAVELLGRTPDFAPWLRTAIPVAAAIALLASPALRRDVPAGCWSRRAGRGVRRRCGPASYSIASVGQSLNGNNVLAGPSAPAAWVRRRLGGGGSLEQRGDRLPPGHQGSATYLLAAVGSQTTSQIIIDTGEPVVTIGGFNGQDPAPTVSQLAKLVADGDLKYVLISDSSGGGPGGGGSSDITTWVKAHGTAVDGVSVGSGTLYAVTS